MKAHRSNCQDRQGNNRSQNFQGFFVRLNLALLAVPLTLQFASMQPHLLEDYRMNAVELLRFQAEGSKLMTASLLADMQDAPLTFPTLNGGNHPTWVAGHLAYSESNLVSHILYGEENPLIAWKERFGRGSEPVAEPTAYPPLADLLARWDEVRVRTLQILDSLTDADLDQPAASPPPGREEFFGTFGKVFSMVAMHPLMHRGQVADARRAAHREALMG